jgi:hypothetical protein
MTVPILDVEVWADLNGAKLGALIATLGDSPDRAGRTLMVMGLDAAEARALVTEAVIGAVYAPRVAGALRALLPIVNRTLVRGDLVEVLGHEEAEARVLLWAAVVAYGWMAQDSGVADE